MNIGLLEFGLGLITALTLSAVYLKKGITSAVASDVKKSVNIESLQKAFDSIEAKLEKQSEKTDIALGQMIRLETEMIALKDNLNKTEQDVKDLTSKVIELKTAFN